MEFNGSVEQNGRTATGIEVPAEVVEGLGAGKRPKVTVTLNGYRYRSSIAVMGGRYLIPVSAEVRERSGVAAGDQVRVGVEVDDAPRTVTIPDDLAAALAADPVAGAAFAALAYSHRLRHVLAVEGARTADTRTRRIASALAALRGT